MAICLHPYLIGVPHRIKGLDDALAYIAAHDGVWFATGERDRAGLARIGRDVLSEVHHPSFETAPRLLRPSIATAGLTGSPPADVEEHDAEPIEAAMIELNSRPTPPPSRPS